MDSFDLLKSLDKQHGKSRDYTILVSIDDITKITDLSQAQKAEKENKDLIQSMTESEKTYNQAQTSKPLEIEEIVVSDGKENDREDKDEGER